MSINRTCPTRTPSRRSPPCNRTKAHDSCPIVHTIGTGQVRQDVHNRDIRGVKKSRRGPRDLALERNLYMPNFRISRSSYSNYQQNRLTPHSLHHSRPHGHRSSYQIRTELLIVGTETGYRVFYVLSTIYITGYYIYISPGQGPDLFSFCPPDKTRSGLLNPLYGRVALATGGITRS